MLDIKFVRENPEALDAAMANRQGSWDRERFFALDEERRSVIAEVEDLNENYQIGASYFLKLKTLDFDQLWTDYLQPLLQGYIQGMYDEEGIMNRFARAYGYQKPARGDANEAAQDQG